MSIERSPSSSVSARSAAPLPASPAPAPAAAPSARTPPSKPCSPHTHKSQPFWLGGLASMGAACCSHPLDLLKVRLQLQSNAAASCAPAATGAAAVSSTSAAAASASPAIGRQSLLSLVGHIIRTDGVLSLYAGLSASLLRQATYSTVRFGCYEGMKQRRLDKLRDAAAARGQPADCLHDLPMMESIGMSLIAGALGGVAGNPADLVNVRRNYAHVGEALVRVSRTEGVTALWNGVGPNVARAMLMTSGQLASYDYFKHALCDCGFDSKRVSTHLTASCLAGVVATVLTQPVDCVKTRVMNASKAAGATQAAPSTLQLVQTMLRTEGLGAFFKGFAPSLVRLGPHTIATFVFLEQLKKWIA